MEKIHKLTVILIILVLILSGIGYYFIFVKENSYFSPRSTGSGVSIKPTKLCNAECDSDHDCRPAVCGYDYDFRCAEGECGVFV